MRWDNQIALFIFMAFAVFITMRGELPIYMGFILGTSAAPAPVASVAPVGGETSGAGKAASSGKGGFVDKAFGILKGAAGIIGGGILF